MKTTLLSGVIDGSSPDGVDVPRHPDPGSTPGASTCGYPGCAALANPIPRKDDEPEGYCALHLKADRRRRRVCLNCGSALASVPEMNELTGRQLKRNGEPVFQLSCADECGYRKRT